MEGPDILKVLVLSEVSDDYEEIEHILFQLTPLADKFDLTIRLIEVRQALIELIETGLVKAYQLSPGHRSAEEIQGIPPENIDGIYYLVTDSGKLKLNAWSRLPPFETAFPEPTDS